MNTTTKGAVCGGVISQSYLIKYLRTNGDPYGLMMAYVMPDKWFVRYEAAVEKGHKETAMKLFKEHAWSQV